MISLYGLFILLLTAETIHAQVHHFITHYAGQPNQGNNDDGDGVDQAFGLKKATGLPQRTTPPTLPKALQESNSPDQNGASSSVDPQPANGCKDGYWFLGLFNMCPQQQSPPESQPFISYIPFQSDEMPLPVLVGESEVESYNQDRNIEQYRKFTEKEAQYFRSEYHIEKELGKGRFGVVYLATRNSDGMEVAYKSIPYKNVNGYTLEPITSPICHVPNPPVCSKEPSAIQCIVYSKKPSVEQCMSPRPPNLLVPYEYMLQMYLSRPGHDNPYVPKVFDYFILEDEYIAVMEYFGEDWVNFSRYRKERIRLEVGDARDIVREVVEALIYLKQYNVVHRDIHGMSQ
ncbi:hypothetical protein BASA82_001122 [Batrachochytrium salamandrivorans]|nr:hypothetical protein BASA82_001122 [Batrachochytrium salamandrivorans]KAH9271879.1 hypothetical protein BASA83_005981 [Batrachochytrium salamandrivorans]